MRQRRILERVWPENVPLLRVGTRAVQVGAGIGAVRLDHVGAGGDKRRQGGEQIPLFICQPAIEGQRATTMGKVGLSDQQGAQMHHAGDAVDVFRPPNRHGQEAENADELLELMGEALDVRLRGLGGVWQVGVERAGIMRG